ncbi:MAG TPA: metallophosphatase domain-containing protein [Kofleriaceae bacterium]
MRIVAVADTHLFHENGYLVPDGDMLIHAGDLCRRGTLEELAVACAWLRALPHATKVVVAGNHDWAFIREPAEARSMLQDVGAIYLEDSGTMLGGLRFWGSPWQPAYNDWAFNLPRGAPLAERWSLIPDGLDVLVTHCPPAGIGDTTEMAGRQGCADLRARVAVIEPRLQLFGHIHNDGGAWREGTTQFANVTSWECSRAPTVIEIDRDRIEMVSVPSGEWTR